MPRKGMRYISFKPSPSPLPPSSPSRTFSDTLMEENIETAEILITKWDSTTHHFNSYAEIFTPLFSGSRKEAKQYLNAVKGLQSAMQHLVALDSTSHRLIRTQFLMQLSMKRLQKEFYQILSSNRDHLDPESISNRSSIDHRSSFSDYDCDFSEDEFRVAGDSISETERVSMIANADLKAIADCMIFSGYGKECVKIYVVMRKSIVDEALYHLGVERLSLSQVQKMDWEVLELKMKYWLNAVKVAVGTLFHGERILCDQVFGEKSIAESCFSEICRDAAMNLFGFPEMVAKCKKSPEKMFRTLDLYEAFSNNWPQIESIFSFDSTSTVRSQAVASMVKLGEAVRSTLADFESAIEKEPSKKPVPGGGVHPLTRYVMNYIVFLADYSEILADILADWAHSPLPENYYRSPSLEENPPSEISTRLTWLILVVLCKLDGEAELYKDVALSYLFLANNMKYVVVKVRSSNLGLFIGEDWLVKHETKVKEYVSKYEHVGWSKVLSSLPPANMPPAQARFHFESFNTSFREAYRKQSSWIVPDPKLRDEIKVSIASKLIPKYRDFYDNHRVGSESVIRFSPDDLGNYLSDILYGIGDSGSVASSSLSPLPSPLPSYSRRSNRRSR